MRVLLTFFVIALTFSQPAFAKGWEHLAERRVTYKEDTDRVNINWFNRDIHQIRLKSKQGIINMDSITLHFRDGSKQVTNDLGILLKGKTSRAINVPRHQSRNLRRVTFKYKSVGNQKTDIAGITKRGIVEIQAKRR
ncbi:hypothetical protein [Photobacterium rosenbergii]|uniref:DUF2541 domain-containing protein n=1 Tax=Photobacterium rosenbergii TaxID=294936 RepID=A0A2T3NBG4_9GAMM|nr:hypothetical protein [Photobacterium rosenbergii]MBY5947360.1 hypothetical protein [Photobacterium rosenbergii]PSW11175.1 hypothetical protein C9J01_17090 [Photobacterium rosenbergii]